MSRTFKPGSLVGRKKAPMLKKTPAMNPHLLSVSSMFYRYPSPSPTGRRAAPSVLSRNLQTIHTAMKYSVFVIWLLFTGTASLWADNYSTAVENLNPVLFYTFQSNLTSNSASGSNAASASLSNSGTTSLSQVTGPLSAGFESDNLAVGGFTAGSSGTLLTVSATASQNASVSALNGSGGITVSAWFELSSAVPSTGSSDVQTIANMIVGNTSSTAFQLNLTSTGITFEGRGSTSDTIDSLSQTETLSTGTWYNVVGVLDFTDKVVNLYLDGVLIGTEAATGWTSTVSLTDGTSAGQFTVGSLGSNGAQAFTSGSLDEESLFNSTLNATEISNLYEAGLMAVPEPPTSALLLLGAAGVLTLARFRRPSQQPIS